MTSKVVCVLGMHRSGTSAITGVLQLLGVALGEKLLAPHRGVNDLGYFEHTDIVDVHDALLAALGSSWDDVRPLADDWWRGEATKPFVEQLAAIVRRDFSGAALWGLKDPRMCRLLEVWFPVFRDAAATPLFLHALRPPADVAASLARRDGFSDEKSRFLWLAYNLAAEKASRGRPRAFLNYDALLADPKGELQRVEQTLGLAWPRPPDMIEKDLVAFLSPSLRHHRSQPEAGTQHDDLAQRAFAALQRLQDDPSDAGGLLEDVHATFTARVAGFDAALLGHLEDVMGRFIDLQETLRNVRASASWTVTKPLRVLQRTASRVLRSHP